MNTQNELTARATPSMEDHPPTQMSIVTLSPPWVRPPSSIVDLYWIEEGGRRPPSSNVDLKNWRAHVQGGGCFKMTSI